ncbi:MAG: transglutaminase domain-containing protein [Eggerthellaceae bacterium]|nr:transglutaminase domain-containing protein [Eggerthellaceae bacterium]
MACLMLCGCGGQASGASGGGSSSGSGGASSSAPGGSGSSDASGGDSSTSGPAYTEPASVLLSTFSEAAAVVSAGGSIDVSTVNQGYVGASATNSSRLKFQVIRGDRTYNYDLPSDGTPIICPINMGDGSYTFRIMQNTSGSNYVEVASATADVALESPFAPYLVPNVFCDYTASSAVVTQARSLAANAQNEGDVVRAVYDWMVDHITYDKDKAAQLADATGYVPSPDSTLSTQTGICFDYASLAAAMFRSLGIPCQIVTGYVSPDNIYHAWNMIYIDGSWVSAQITVNPDTWTRVDLTFAAAGAGGTIGDGTTYTDRYTY